MTTGILDQVRAACADVAGRASYVHLDTASLPVYAASLALVEIPASELDPRYHYFGRPEESVAFVLTLDGINFGSGYFPHLRKRPGLSGYFTVAASLTDHFRQHGPFSAAALTALNAADCAGIFAQDLDNPPVAELMGLFANALNDLGRYVGERYGGQFTALVEAADHSAERLVALLAHMPYFRDVELYEGRTVPFYKRAQLSAADLALALDGQGLGAFSDLDQLTIFADNLVPHVLRVDGVLRYEAALTARIDAGELIPAGSPEEVEIRACAVHAVESLVGELRRAGQHANAMRLDYVLWNRGQQPAYKAIPRHRTRTVFY
jgi:hypothetical protein